MKNKGFTLIELIIAVMIIGIIALIIVNNFVSCGSAERNSNVIIQQQDESKFDQEESRY